MNKLFENFDKINKTNSYKNNKYKRLVSEYDSLLEMFENDVTLDENIDNEKRKLVVDYINKNQFDNDPKEFHNSLNKNKHQKMLTNYSVGELSQMKLFKVPNFNIGYALKKRDNNKYDEIVALHNSEEGVSGIGDILVQSAIKNGGCYLDHFDGFLSNVYERNGFVEYERDAYNPEYDKDGSFKNKYGESDVIYRVHKSCKK